MVLLLLSLACKETKLSDCEPSAASGTISATVSDGAWSSVGQWLWSGSSLQINTDAADGWLLSFVVQMAADGTPIADALAAGSFPVEVTLHAGEEGGWVTAYPDAGASYYSGDADGGTMLIAGQDGTTLTGCFAFEAINGDGDAVDVADGQFNFEEASL